MNSFLNSLLIASGTTFCSLVIGLPLAVLLTKTNIPFRKWFRYLYLLPIFIPPSVMTLGWLSLDFCNKGFYSLWGSISLLSLCYFPFVTLLSIGGLSAVGRDIEESARIEYGELGVLRLVTIPYAYKHICAGLFFVFIFSISNYEIPALLGVQTYIGEIFVQFSGFYNTRKALMLSFPFVALISLLLIFVVRFLQDKDFVAIGQDAQKVRVILLSKFAKLIAGIFVAAIIGVSVIVPLVMLMNKAQGLTVYTKAFMLSRAELGFSLQWTLIAAVLITAISFFISYLIERSKRRIRHLLTYLSILPFAIPPAVIGIALIKLFNRPALNFIYTTPLILLIGYFIRFAPFAIRILCVSISHIDKNLEDEATIEGAGFFRKLFMIDAPLCRQGFVISLVIVFALIMGELGMTILVVPAGSATLILKIYTLMHYGVSKLVAALAIILILAVVILGGIMALTNKIAKKFFLILLLSVMIMQFIPGICSAQSPKDHLYSTWDFLELDTCTSAWLIKRFIDKDASFKFYPKGDLVEEGVAFDTPDAEFRRTQNMSTFETLVRRYDITDSRVVRMAEIIHEIEVNYWQEANEEGAQKLNNMIRDIIDNSKSAPECFKETFSFLDGFYAELKTAH